MHVKAEIDGTKNVVDSSLRGNLLWHIQKTYNAALSSHIIMTT